jgi:hypothetical protein
MLGAGWGSSQLALLFDEARCLVEPLVFAGVHSGVFAALTSVGSHYDAVDYDAMGQGYSSRKSDAEILAIGNSAARGAGVLMSKVLATIVPCIGIFLITG